MGSKPRHNVPFATRSLAAFVPPKPRQTATGNTWGCVDLADPNCPGLVLRVSYGGARVWYLLYWHGGRRRRLKIGPFPVLGIADAREMARDAQRSIIRGADPATARQADRVIGRGAHTTNQLG